MSNKEKLEKQEKQETNTSQPSFMIQKIYVKDVSYEAPHTPDVFKTEWKPDVKMDLNTDSKKLAEGIYEATMKVTITTKIKDTVAFLVEVIQAGIFTIKDFPQEQMGPMLGSFCPNILFPYIRETISNVVERGGFPPLYLAPINFDAVYQQQLENAKKK